MSRTATSAHALREATARPWSDAAGRAALGVVLVQVLWRGWYVVHGFFTQDDFVIIAMARRKSLGQLLFSDYYGHLLPARWLLAEVVAHGGQLPWGLAATMILVLMAATSALMWVVLTRLLPGRWARLPVLALFCFTPLTLWTTQQWIVAMQFYPVTICLLLGVVALVRHLEDGWLPGRWGPALAMAAALLFQERALLFPLVFVGTALITVEGGFGARVLTALRRGWATWATLAAVVVGYFAVHVAAAPIRARPLAHEGGDLVALVGNFLFRNAVPGLLGGPWRPVLVGSAIVQPPSWAVFLAVAAMAAVVGWTVARGGPRAWWAWIMLGVAILGDVAILFGGRSQFGADVGLISRYAADLSPVLALALAAALRDVPVGLPDRVTRRLGGRRAPMLLALGSAAVVLVAALPTTAVLAGPLENRDDRTYATNLAAEVAKAPDTPIYDSLPPADILVPWFGDWSRMSTVLETVRPRPRYDVPVQGLLTADPSGRLHPIQLQGSAISPRGPSKACGYPVHGDPVTVPLDRPVPLGRHVARFDYFSGSDSLVTARFVGAPVPTTVQFAAGSGLHSIFVPVQAPVSSIVVQNDDPRVTICLGKVAVGTPRPAG